MIDSESSALEIARAVGGGETSAAAVVEAALARIEKLNPLLNAFTDVTAARALSAPRHSMRSTPRALHSGRSPACRSR
jgi:1-carboxybiuret hydrolase